MPSIALCNKINLFLEIIYPSRVKIFSVVAYWESGELGVAH